MSEACNQVLTEKHTPISQNTGMRLPLLCLILISGSCASTQTSRLEAGDRYFRMGEFHEAFLAYGPEAETDDEVLLARIHEARFRSILQSAEERVLVDDIEATLLLLTHAESMHPGYPQIEELRQLANRRRAAELTLQGESFLDDGEFGAAVAVFREALRWNPANDSAQKGFDTGAAKRGFELANSIHNSHNRHAEELYFDGLRQSSEGHNARARVSFLHAASVLGEDSRAQLRLDEMSNDIAVLQVQEAESFIENGMLGAAWIALSDAVRLSPDHEHAQELYASVSKELGARRLIEQADLHVRGGRIQEADILLQRILDVTGDSHSERVDSLRQLALQKHSERTYQLARACELDQQIMRAVRIYDQILIDSNYGFEDLTLRIDNLHQRIEKAEASFAKALAAEKAGEVDAYRRYLVETIELAGDYPEALARLEKLADR
jgi:tetratricopeptide (TPR) repeat protein